MRTCNLLYNLELFRYGNCSGIDCYSACEEIDQNVHYALFCFDLIILSSASHLICIYFVNWYEPEKHIPLSGLNSLIPLSAATNFVNMSAATDDEKKCQR